MLRALSLALVIASASDAAHAAAAESTCHGRSAQGTLENGWQLPAEGKNFKAYSKIGVASGRTYVHSRVHRVILNAYKDLEISAPSKQFIYGETGFAQGGVFKPHRTHQNGLSVDFFVPVLDQAGQSVPLPISIFNKLGYNIEFDTQGYYKDLRVDFEALAKHLTAIADAAHQEGISIKMVILDPAFREHLKTIHELAPLPDDFPFATFKPWVRHDEHYHIDFIVPCEP